MKWGGALGAGTAADSCQGDDDTNLPHQLSGCEASAPGCTASASTSDVTSCQPTYARLPGRRRGGRGGSLTLLSSDLQCSSNAKLFLQTCSTGPRPHQKHPNRNTVQRRGPIIPFLNSQNKIAKPSEKKIVC